MKVLSGIRQSGKTTRLLEEANGRDLSLWNILESGRVMRWR